MTTRYQGRLIPKGHKELYAEYAKICRNKPFEHNAKQCRLLFRRWEEQDITTQECWKEFLEVQGINKDRETDLKAFAGWLNSLGYVRGL